VEESALEEYKFNWVARLFYLANVIRPHKSDSAAQGWSGRTKVIWPNKGGAEHSGQGLRFRVTRNVSSIRPARLAGTARNQFSSTETSRVFSNQMNSQLWWTCYIFMNG